jgi:Zn-dependent metalloprotease
MFRTHKFVNLVLSIVVVFSMTFTLTQSHSAFAQGQDGLKRQFNTETGKVSFIGSENERSLSASAALGIQPGSSRPADPATALAKRFAPEFGIKDASRELSKIRTNHPGDGRLTVRYQQNYEGIPVLGGELIVNTNENGDLYSMNGEVSSDLPLSTEPTIDPVQARKFALQGMAKWYQKSPSDFTTTEPELWIFDESLVQPSNRPAELVWRMEATPVDNGIPVRELVLVDAQSGNISLHFNQVDTAWATTRASEAINLSASNPLKAGTWPVYFEAALDESRGWIYGSDSAGNKIDVIAMDTLQLVKSFQLVDGAAPKGIALSPDGSELTIAQFGASSILFLDPDTEQTLATIVPDVTVGPNKPWDVIYGRTGRLYSSGHPDSSGFDYIHVIDTATHTEISKSSYIIRSAPSLAISSDKNTLYANQATFSPNKLYKFDISTDTIPDPTSTPHTSGFTANAYLLLHDESQIFTSTGQVWSNPGDLSASVQTGSFNDSGYLTEIPSSNLVAVVSETNPGQITFVDSMDYSTKSTLSLPSVTAAGASVITTDESKLFVSTNSGMKVISLDPSEPSSISIVSGSNQSAPLQSQFSQPLKAKVQNYLQEPLSGKLVTFTAPASGATGVFLDTNSNSTTAITDANGVVISSTLSANNTAGGYLVHATVSGLASSASFVLNNGGLKKIKTYTASNGSSLPGQFLCNQAEPTCTGGGNVHADRAHKYAIGTHSLYYNKHGRDSINNSGMVIISSVHYSSNYANAFWNGTQMVYGDGYGFPLADDVVAHELTHGVTDYESNLFYFYQSGAINESFSDLWGEYYDQTNGQGNDAGAVKWLLGEDITGLGAIRSMKHPPQFGDPDKMTSSLYYKGLGDNGGVHYNSGVNNKAVYLMVQGGTFNNKTITGIGWNKTAAIYYEAQTNLLSSGSDYSDLYYALQQACKNLTGLNGITSANCIQVKNALNAVQMNAQPAAGFNPDAPVCPAGQSTGPSLSLFSDDLESGSTKWTKTGNPASAWALDEGYASSSSHMFYGNDSYVSNISTLTIKTGILLPAGSTPYLHFKHAFLFEYYGSQFYDGGVLEYTTNNGTTWLDAKPLFSTGKNYGPGSISADWDNALGGRQAFVADSHGYVSSRYALSTLAGKTVKFRWRFATDFVGYYLGWVVDDVKVYTCVGTPSIPTLKTPLNGVLVMDYTPLLNWTDSGAYFGHYQIQLSTASNFSSLLYNKNDLTTSQFTIPSNLAPNTTFYWRVRSINALGKSKGWSSTFSFRTALSRPVLLDPADGSTSGSLTPTFDWNDVGGAAGYDIQVSTDPTFVTALIDDSVVASTYAPATDLPSSTTIYWHVRSTGSNGPSGWSSVFSFTTP